MDIMSFCWPRLVIPRAVAAPAICEAAVGGGPGEWGMGSGWG